MRWTTLISGYIFYCRPTGQFYVFLTNNQGSISYKWEGWIFHAENCKLPPPTSLFDDKCLWPIRKLSDFICRVCCEKCLNGQFQTELLFLPFPPTFQGRKELSKIFIKKRRKSRKSFLVITCYLDGGCNAGRKPSVAKAAPWQSIASTCVFALGVHLHFCTSLNVCICKCALLQMCTFAFVYISKCVLLQMCDSLPL